MRIPRDHSPNDKLPPIAYSSGGAAMTSDGSEDRSNGPSIPTFSNIPLSTARDSPSADEHSNDEDETAENGDELVDELENLTLAQQQPVPVSSNLGQDLPHLRGRRRGSDGYATSADLYNATPRSSPSPNREPGSRRIEQNKDIHEGLEITPDIGSLNLGHDGSEYNVREEPLPREPYFNRGFQTALKLATGVASDIYKSIDSCGRPQEPLPDLYKHMETAKRKSSLINSLLDIRNLAHKGDWGSAVTSFVTEYRYRERRHTATFTIEVEYCTESEIDEQLHEMMISYREQWRPGLEEENISTEELHKIETKSGEALSTLESIFGYIEQLEPRRLQDFSEGAFENTYKELRASARDLKWPDGAENGKWSSIASDAEECQEKVGLFKEDGLWPLTNVVRIYLSAQVLKSGIVLADMPGYRDINLARVKKAQQYLIRCDEIFIVASIDRIESNLTVKELLRAQFRSTAERNKNIAIVCTHADDIHLPSAEKESPQIAKLASTKKAKAQLWEAYSKPVALYHLAEIRYKYIFIAARNRKVTSKLASIYPQLSGNGRSNIYCIGNDDYEGNKLHHGSAAHKLALASSGVPELRRFCHSVAAKAQFHASEYFLNVELPSLVQSLEIWLQGFQQTAVAAIPADCIRHRQASIKTLIDENRQNLVALVQDQILNALNGERERALSDDAVTVSRSWARIHGHHASYKAWVRNNGTHYTRTRHFKCWNTELLYEMNKALPEKWNILETKIGDSTTKLKESIDADFVGLDGQLRDLQAPEAVLQFVKLKKQEMAYTLNEERDKLLRATGTCRYNTTGAHLSSYALEAMLPIYRACNEEHGTGMLRRMEGIMDDGMSRRPVFAHVREQAQVFVEAQIKLMHLALVEKLECVCGALKEQVGALRGPLSEAARCGDGDREGVGKALAAARRGMKDVQREAAAAREEARALGY